MKRNFCKYCDTQFAALSVQKRFCSPECRVMFAKEGKSLRQQVNEKIELKQQEMLAREEAAREAERQSRMIQCRMCTTKFESKKGSIYCSDTCRQRMIKFNQAILRSKNREEGKQNTKYSGDRTDRCYEERDFSEEFEKANPYVVETLLHEAHERNKKIEYNHRCAVCMSRMPDESIKVEGQAQPIKNKWYCSDGCYSIREPKIKTKGAYRHKVSSGEGMKYV